ncbi:MAG: class I SAM-dependent methyltransferase [Rhodocyclaceae bacterium]|jgi:SAM-dependent methyltransferase|nr:class I SAM-dependent methyltransferase [Rhodocyclaceae bacterium]
MARRLKNINRALVTEAVTMFATALATGARVLDVGAGSGHYGALFARQNYLAIDHGYEQKDRKGLSAVADIGAIPLADCSVDNAICMEVLEHLHEPMCVLLEIHRVVRPGGEVLVSTPLCLGEHMQPYDFQRYTRYALQEMFVRSGFSVLSIQPRGGFFTLLAYLVARIPDELLRHRSGWWWSPVKPLLRLVTTYSLAPLFLALDFADRRREFTLGFVSRIRRI